MFLGAGAGAGGAGMTITTEETERLAERLSNDAEAPQSARYQPYTDHAMCNAAVALRSLAAERDALQAENARLREALKKAAKFIADQYESPEAQAMEGEYLAKEARPIWETICNALAASVALGEKDNGKV